MSEEAIRKLRQKFMIYAMLSLTLVMLLMAGMIYVINLCVSRNEIRETMAYIISYEGEIQDAETIYEAAGTDNSAQNPEMTPDKAGQGGNGTDQKENAEQKTDDWISQFRKKTSPDTEETKKFRKLDESIGKTPYDIRMFLNDVFGAGSSGLITGDSPDDTFSTRYFAVLYAQDGEVESVKANHISSLTAQEAEALGDYARGRLLTFGQYGKYYYQSAELQGERGIVVFLDSTNQIHATSRLLYSAMMLFTFGIALTFLFVCLFANKAIAPEIRNAELQKQFITNASHELKTPLAVIRANTEMQEILGGENEWTQSTLRQVDRLNGLIQNLVMITRTQEKESSERSLINVAELMRDTVKTYLPVACQDEKVLEQEIPDCLNMMAVDSEIRQLTTLLLDNAIKYCDGGGTIRVSAGQKGRETWMVVSNSYAEGANVDYSRFFERFYRQNEAHTIESQSRGGYGIGLSIAENLVEKYNGSIRADWKNGMISFTCTLK